MKTLKDLPLEEKRALYTSWIDELHDQKVEETRRKVARFGYTDEDDYHLSCGRNVSAHLHRMDGAHHGLHRRKTGC